ncbi:MAG: polymerase, sigma-24 subunit, subfamily [Pseudonocardiales bacterium]|nr:polymerase, sigma-24 subunit, subfamily [Pseudonocardiales bacterium]
MHALAVRLSSASEADEAVQEALVAAWRKWSQYEPERGTPRNWLLAIVADQAGKSRRRRRPTLELVDGPAANTGGDLDLRAAVVALPPRQRVALELRYYLQLPLAEIAEVMGCAEGTVKSTLAAARAGLRTTLGEDFR